MLIKITYRYTAGMILLILCSALASQHGTSNSLCLGAPVRQHIECIDYICDMEMVIVASLPIFSIGLVSWGLKCNYLAVDESGAIVRL